MGFLFSKVLLLFSPSVIICLFDQCTADYPRRSANILRTINTLFVVSIDLLPSKNLQMYLEAAGIACAHLLTIKLLIQHIRICMIKKLHLNTYMYYSIFTLEGLK